MTGHPRAAVVPSGTRTTAGCPWAGPGGCARPPRGSARTRNSPGLTRQVRAGSLSMRAPPARLTLRQVRGADSPIGSSAEGFSEHTPRPGDVIAAADVCGPLGKPVAIIGARAQPGPRVKRPEPLNSAAGSSAGHELAEFQGVSPGLGTQWSAFETGVSRKFQSLLWTQAGATGVGNFISRSSLNQRMSDPEAPPGLGQVGEKTACPSVLLGAGPAPAAAPEGEGGRASLC